MHPWFRSPSLKRKASSSDEESDTPTVRAAPLYLDSPSWPAKRRRCDVLEHGIAQLSLDTNTGISAPSAQPLTSHSPQVESVSEDIPLISAPSVALSEAVSLPLYTFVQRPLPGAVQAGSIEEPPSPEHELDEDAIVDVAMSSESWYEIEKDSELTSSLHTRTRIPTSFRDHRNRGDRLV